MKYILQCIKPGAYYGIFMAKGKVFHRNLDMAEVFDSVALMYATHSEYVRSVDWVIKELKTEDFCTLQGFVSGTSGLASTAASAITGPPKSQAQLFQEKLLKNKEERIKAHREAYERQLHWQDDVRRLLFQLVENTYKAPAKKKKRSK